MVWPVIIVSQILILFLVVSYSKKFNIFIPETTDGIPLKISSSTLSAPVLPVERTPQSPLKPGGKAIQGGGTTHIPDEKVVDDWLLGLMKPEKATLRAEDKNTNAHPPRRVKSAANSEPPVAPPKKTGLTAFLDELASSEKPIMKTQRTSPQPPVPGGTGTGIPSRQAMNKPAISPAREIPEPPEKKTLPLLEFKDKMSEKDLQKLQAMAQKVSQSTAPSHGSEGKTGMTSSPGYGTQDSSLSHEAPIEPPVTPAREVRDLQEKKTGHLNEFLDKMSGQDAQKLAGTPFDRLIQKRMSGPVKPSSKKSEEHIAPADAAEPGDSAS